MKRIMNKSRKMNKRCGYKEVDLTGDLEVNQEDRFLPLDSVPQEDPGLEVVLGDIIEVTEDDFTFATWTNTRNMIAITSQQTISQE